MANPTSLPRTESGSSWSSASSASTPNSGSKRKGKGILRPVSSETENKRGKETAESQAFHGKPSFTIPLLFLTPGREAAVGDSCSETASIHSALRISEVETFGDLRGSINTLSASQKSRVFDDISPFHGRNRNNKLLPYKDNRFCITGDDSFYYNASLMLDKTLIACQGPLPKEIDSFWKMVAVSNASTLVMLTNLTNRRKIELCSQYWPEVGSTISFPEITIKGETEAPLTLSNPLSHEKEVISSIAKRTFTLEFKDVRHTVVQYHYLGWEEGAETDPLMLKKLIEVVHQCAFSESSPLICHCSGGIGRTGVFVAVLKGYRHFIATKEVLERDSLILSLREERMGMVETVEQAECMRRTLDLFKD